jgi:DNA transformation protein
MPNSADFITHVLELMRAAAPATARAMFGGHGLYVGGTIVGLVVDDVVYFKTDERNRDEFAAQGLDAFVYVTKRGDRMLTSYHRAPDETLESAQAMERWLRSATGAALRSAAAKPAREKARRYAGVGQRAAKRAKPMRPRQ